MEMSDDKVAVCTAYKTLYIIKCTKQKHLVGLVSNIVETSASVYDKSIN